MTTINLLDQSRAFEHSQPSPSGRLDVTWSGGIGTIDAGKIVTKGGSRNHKHKHSRKHRHSRKCGCGHRKHQKHQTRKARRSRH